MANQVQSQNPRESKLSQEFLRNSLDYDPDTGIFTWKHRADRSRRWNSRYAGTRAGCLNAQGRFAIALSVDGEKKPFLAYRLAFIFMTAHAQKLLTT